MNNQTDKELVEEYLKTRSEGSFLDLYRRHTPALYATARRLSQSSEPAEDAIQDAWVRACMTVHDFRWESSLRTWLTGIVINCIREQARKERRYVGEPLDEAASGGSIAENGSLGDLIARMPNGYREVLILHDVEGFTHEEIGRSLNISVGTSKSQLHHARKNIRALLSGES